MDEVPLHVRVNNDVPGDDRVVLSFWLPFPVTNRAHPRWNRGRYVRDDLKRVVVVVRRIAVDLARLDEVPDLFVARVPHKHPEDGGGRGRFRRPGHEVDLDDRAQEVVDLLVQHEAHRIRGCRYGLEADGDVLDLYQTDARIRDNEARREGHLDGLDLLSRLRLRAVNQERENERLRGIGWHGSRWVTDDVDFSGGTDGGAGVRRRCEDRDGHKRRQRKRTRGRDAA